MSNNRRKIISYNPILKDYARRLRNNSTKSEIILWQHLKNKQVLGYDFDRQRPVDNYILDFFCYDLMLGIEIDGVTHTWEEVKINDKVKEIKMQWLGITILRFEDDQVKADAEYIIREIKNWILKTHPVKA